MNEAFKYLTELTPFKLFSGTSTQSAAKNKAVRFSSLKVNESDYVKKSTSFTSEKKNTSILIEKLKREIEISDTLCEQDIDKILVKLLSAKSLKRKSSKAMLEERTSVNMRKRRRQTGFSSTPIDESLTKYFGRLTKQRSLKRPMPPQSKILTSGGKQARFSTKTQIMVPNKTSLKRIFESDIQKKSLDFDKVKQIPDLGLTGESAPTPFSFSFRAKKPSKTKANDPVQKPKKNLQLVVPHLVERKYLQKAYFFPTLSLKSRKPIVSSVSTTITFNVVPIIPQTKRVLPILPIECQPAEKSIQEPIVKGSEVVTLPSTQKKVVNEKTSSIYERLSAVDSNKWKCETCLVRNPNSSDVCQACNVPKPNFSIKNTVPKTQEQKGFLEGVEQGSVDNKAPLAEPPGTSLFGAPKANETTKPPLFGVKEQTNGKSAPTFTFGQPPKTENSTTINIPKPSSALLAKSGANNVANPFLSSQSGVSGSNTKPLFGTNSSNAVPNPYKPVGSAALGNNQSSSSSLFQTSAPVGNPFSNNSFSSTTVGGFSIGASSTANKRRSRRHKKRR